MTYNAEGLVGQSNLIGAVSGAPKMLYSYVTNDTKATVEGAGYFNSEAGRLNVGDAILVSGDVDGTPFITIYTVSSNDGSTVAITDQAAITQNVQNVLTADNVDLIGGNAAQVRFVMPFAGTIDKIYSVISGALTTGNATITADIGGVAVTDGVITITQAGSAEDDVDSATPSAAKTFAAGDVVTLTVGGTNDASRTANITMLVSPT